MKIDKEECRNLDQALSLEWLEVDGRTIPPSTNLDGSQQRGEARPGIP